MNEDNHFVDNKSAALRLMRIKGGARGIPFNAKRDRFNMLHCADTSIRKDLNANRIIINGSNIAIATQYPFFYQLEAQLQMLVDNRTPALIVLASDNDIKANQLPEYFSSSATFGQIQTSSSFVKQVDLTSGIEGKMYQLKITGYQVSIDIPVVHVLNWPDHQTVSPEATSDLVELIESTVSEKRRFYEERNSRAIYDNKKILPVIHCRAGVGRTGQTIAAMAIKRFPELNLASITKGLRVSRNDYMIQTLAQMETLLKLERDA